jgi:site-specific recombinase XerD
LQANGKPFVCPKCGQEGIRHSSSRCQTCYQLDSFQKRLDDGIVLLQHPWSKSAWQGFGVALLAKTSPIKAMLRINNYFLLFSRLDVAFAKPAEVTPVALLKVTGGLDGLRRFAVPFGYLIQQSIIPEATRDLLEEEAESLRQESMLAALEGKWFAPVLGRYRKHLMSVRARYESRGWKGDASRMKPRTISSNLRGARRFCELLDDKGIRMIQQTTPELLDTFLAEYSGLRNSIRAFVRYLNRKEKLFQRLKLENVPQGLPEGIFLPREKYLGLLRDWLNPADDALRESLIGLFMLLYAQTIKNCIRIRLEDLSKGRDHRYRIAFGRTEIHLDSRISTTLDRYLGQRRALAALETSDENPYLFPGRQFGGHLNASSVSLWLKNAGVRAEQLFATAIFTAYQNGLRLPKVLVRAFGITVPTAIKYLNMLDPRLVMEIERKTPDIRATVQ